MLHWGGRRLACLSVMTPSLRRLALALLACLVVAGCDGLVGPASPDGIPITGVNSSGGGGSVPVTQQVTVGDGFYSPATLSIAVGDTVLWTWAASAPHSVTFSDGHDSGLKSSGTYTRNFLAAGTFTYKSSLVADSGMVGSIVVQ